VDLRDGVARAVSDSTPKRAGPESDRESQTRSSRLLFLLITTTQLAVKDVLVKSFTGWEQERHLEAWSKMNYRSDIQCFLCTKVWTHCSQVSPQSPAECESL